MCQICETVKSLGTVDEALKYIAWKSIDGLLPPCVDKLVGELIGEPEPQVDKKGESDWSKANG